MVPLSRPSRLLIITAIAAAGALADTVNCTLNYKGVLGIAQSDFTIYHPDDILNAGLSASDATVLDRLGGQSQYLVSDKNTEDELWGFFYCQSNYTGVGQQQINRGQGQVRAILADGSYSNRCLSWVTLNTSVPLQYITNTADCDIDDERQQYITWDGAEAYDSGGTIFSGPRVGWQIKTPYVQDYSYYAIEVPQEDGTTAVQAEEHGDCTFYDDCYYDRRRQIGGRDNVVTDYTLALRALPPPPANLTCTPKFKNMTMGLLSLDGAGKKNNHFVGISQQYGDYGPTDDTSGNILTSQEDSDPQLQQFDFYTCDYSDIRYKSTDQVLYGQIRIEGRSDTDKRCIGGTQDDPHQLQTLVTGRTCDLDQPSYTSRNVWEFHLDIDGKGTHGARRFVPDDKGNFGVKIDRPHPYYRLSNLVSDYQAPGNVRAARKLGVRRYWLTFQ